MSVLIFGSGGVEEFGSFGEDVRGWCLGVMRLGPVVRRFGGICPLSGFRIG